MNIEQLSGEQADELRAWVQLWLLEATAAGFIDPPYAADDELLERAIELHEFGLDPLDAALSMFGTKH